MRIKQILSQNRRDFQAIYECEHCGCTEKGTGYDDANFHQKVIPAWECGKCHKTADESYKPMEPKYPEGMLV